MLKTEMRNPKTMHLDKMSTMEMLQAMNAENYRAIDAVEQALPRIARAVEAVTEAFANGGRMFYLGAGTSGGLAVLDAAECPLTFGVPADQVIGLHAGGEKAMTDGGFEDSPEAAISDLKARNLEKRDLVVGLSASGGAAYVVGGLEYAKSLGCITVGVTSNEGSPLDKTADLSIVTDTGPEVVTGSTRLKAGTAQKTVLNMLSTCAMVRRGLVYENLMINLQPGNAKLKQRLVSMLCEIRSIPEAQAEALLRQADWDIRAVLDEKEI